MKATELMVGDWYSNSSGDYCKVIKNFGNEVWGQGNDVSDSTDNPHPISLTEEILRMNGFYENKSYLLYAFYDGWNFEIHNKTMMVSCGSIWHVHELQHALRLCGLNELADNFKI